MSDFILLSSLMKSDRPENKIVAHGNGQARTFGAFRQSVLSTIERLESRNLDSVVLATQDAYDYCIGFMAALHAGCRIIVPPNLQPGTLDSYATKACPLLCEGGRIGSIEGIEIGGEHASGRKFGQLDPEKGLLEFYTSGSTGTPKRIPKSLAQIENELVVLHATWGEQLSGAVTLGTVTHQHIYGLYFKALWPLAASRPFFGQTFEIWEEMLAVAPPGSCLVSSPAHLSRIPGFDPLAKADRPQMILSAGGPLSYPAAQSAKTTFGVLPTEIFGSTETGGIAHRQQETETTPFKPLAGMETRVDDTGLLSVRSNYTDNRDWAETNDLAMRFEDGRFLLTGRSDQFFKIEGKRLSLKEVEDNLLRSPLVTDAAVLLLQEGRESLVAVVELSNPGRSHLDEMGPFRLNRHLRHFLQDTLEPAAMPKRWRFVDKLPTNSQGKRMRSTLEELFKR